MGSEVRGSIADVDCEKMSEAGTFSLTLDWSAYVGDYRLKNLKGYPGRSFEFCREIRHFTSTFYVILIYNTVYPRELEELYWCGFTDQLRNLDQYELAQPSMEDELLVP